MTTNTVLNGGTLNGEIATKTLTVDGGGFDFSMQSGTLTVVSNATLKIISADLSGNGTIDVAGSEFGTVTLDSTVDTTGFSGMFNVSGSTFDLAEITTGSFGMTLTNNGVYKNDANIILTSLMINGTNVVASETAYDYAALNAAGYGDFIGDNGETITVIPEPATIGMLGLGALITMFIRRKLTA